MPHSLYTPPSFCFPSPLDRTSPPFALQATTGFLCFTLSAVLHELVVALPFRSYYMPLAFFGMMAQVPMLPLSAWMRRKTRGSAFEQSGNFLFWITFCFVGQPLCVQLYYMHATMWAES